ncbi:MAG: hypothetical protein M1818_007085 [Claussenomyces sp. TS43310]|nr:MAG: hypothetical protein M1818_007085 [Claussenomyces sp. TS43310]
MKLTVSLLLALGAVNSAFAAPIDNNAAAEKREPMVYEEATAKGGWIPDKREDKRMVYEEATAKGGWIPDKREDKRMVYEEATAKGGWIPDKQVEQESIVVALDEEMGFATKAYSRLPLEGHGITEDPLLPTQEKVADGEDVADQRRLWAMPIKKNSPWLLHLLLISFYTAIYLYTQIKLVKGTKQFQDLIYTPVKQVVEFEKKVFHITVNDTNVYNMPPSPESDDAWSVLLQNMNLRLSGNDLRALNKTSVMLADGSGDYMGTLDVYHQLHCLQYIREVVHGDYYKFYKSTVSPIDHADHCIESLRQSVMCNPDLSVLTFNWLPDIQGPWPEFESEHQCANWEKIDAWAGQRAFNMSEPNLLVHPTFGPLYKSPTSEVA